MEDERQEELDIITAIYPEIIFSPDNQFSATIELAVNPTSSVKVIFPHATDGSLPTPPQSANSEQDDNRLGNGLANDFELHDLSYLPSIHVHIVLPEGYPAEKPPHFELSTNPEWLSRSHLDKLQAHGKQLWEDSGRNTMVYDYLLYLQLGAEDAFGFAAEGKILEIPQDLQIALLDHDIKAKQDSFDRESFTCGVCLEAKKGSVCHKMMDCGHVFCVECLQDFYNNAINEGDLASVRCLEPGCAKKRDEARQKKSRKSKTQLNPSELLQIPIEHDMVTRYVRLKHKAELESDKNTIYCPRKWCQGAARSKKHRKPEGLVLAGDSDDESDEEPEVKGKVVTGIDLLSICEDCGYAFCSRCYQGWHGELKSCGPRRSTGELTAEDQASVEYMKLHTTPCPTCAVPAQKTHGCNHMICWKCQSHFCYLCSAWLSPTNPYKHYNEEKASCYMRLWELEGGDGDDVGLGFGGGDHPIAVPVEEGEAEIEVAEDPDIAIIMNQLVDVPEIVEPDEPDQPAEPQVQLPEVQREGPLIFRINRVLPRPAPAPAVPDPPPANRRNRGGQRPAAPNGRGNPRRGRGQGGRRFDGPQREARDNMAQNAAQREEVDQQWIDQFVRMAMNDEEDQLESDDENEAWVIPERDE